MSATQRATRGLATMGALALMSLGLGRAAVWLNPPVREAWFVVGVNSDTALVFARMSKANTGFFRDAVTTRLAAMPRSGFAVEHRGMLGPTAATPAGVQSGGDRIEQVQGTWQLRIAGEDVQLRGAVATAQPLACPPPVGRLTGVLGVGDGGNASSAMLLDGQAVVTHSVSAGPVRNRALYVLGPNFAAGIDPIADCAAWVRGPEGDWTGTAPAVPDGDGEIVLGPWTLTLRRQFDALRLLAHPNLMAVETFGAWLVGWSEPVQTLQRVAVSVSGPGFEGPRTGVVIRRE